MLRVEATQDFESSSAQAFFISPTRFLHFRVLWLAVVPLAPNRVVLLRMLFGNKNEAHAFEYRVTLHSADFKEFFFALK